MLSFMNRFRDESYALLRIVSGSMFAVHGAQKFFGILTDRPAQVFPSQGWWGGVIELVGGLLIAFGFQTRLAAFISSGTMLVAYSQFHWKGQFGANFIPNMNQGEMAVLYCLVFLVIAAQGSGKWSVDKN